MRFLCRIGWHDWANWVLEEPIDVYWEDDKVPFTRKQYQTRTCKECNKFQRVKLENFYF